MPLGAEALDEGVFGIKPRKTTKNTGLFTVLTSAAGRGGGSGGQCSDQRDSPGVPCRAAIGGRQACRVVMEFWMRAMTTLIGRNMEVEHEPQKTNFPYKHWGEVHVHVNSSLSLIETPLLCLDCRNFTVEVVRTARRTSHHCFLPKPDTCLLYTSPSPRDA